ncbi:MAG: diaminopimelate decarboxylase, partial [Proteobacteria bacterium]|nr:diaminopimelate decarboxylase [Pseudomonadota bacterium]
PLPPLQRGDLLVIRGAGAYGASMASNYNGRPRAPEVMVEADLTQLIRSRETIEDTWRGEMCCT